MVVAEIDAGKVKSSHVGGKLTGLRRRRRAINLNLRLQHRQRRGRVPAGQVQSQVVAVGMFLPPLVILLIHLLLLVLDLGLLGFEFVDRVLGRL